MQRRLSLPSILTRRDWRDDLSAYLDDELTPRERERVETRLAQSEEMQEYFDDLQNMRTALKSFAPAPSAAPFQLTPEIIGRSTLTPLVPSGATRALRLSMATATVGVAAFAAVMVFDAIDSPTVTFTTTQAGDASRGVPTAQVVTEEVEVPPQSAAPTDPVTVTAVSSGPEPSVRVEPAAIEAEQAETEQEAAVAEVEQADVGQVQAEQQTDVAVEAQEAEMAQAMQEAQEVGQQQAESYAAEQQDGQASQAESVESAADDPSRRALTAGRQATDAEEDVAAEVTADDVVAQEVQAEAEPADAAAAVSQATEEPAPAAVSADEQAAESQTAGPAEDERDDDALGGEAQSESERRTVASSVRHTESDWPLEERPRSRSVELATDPAWERPVQIVLAAFAVAATTFWLTLAIMDRRRRT